LKGMIIKKTKNKRFSYKKWANDVAASILQSDLDSGLEVASETPDRIKAEAAIQKLIHKLTVAGDRQTTKNQIDK
jgi:hypothetical protein